MSPFENPSQNPSQDRTPPRQVRIIAAITDRERELFLGDIPTQQAPFDGFEFADENSLTPAGWEQRLESWQPEILITGWNTPKLPDSWLARADCPLRYVCHIVGSVRQLVPRSFLEGGGIVTNWGGRVSSQVAEHGLLLALAALRNLAAWGPYIYRPIHEREIMDLRTRTLFGRRVGIHGFGSVARALLPLLQSFGVTVTAYSAGVPDEMFRQHGVQSTPTLKELFANSEVFFECESLTPSTQGMVTAALLAALPDGAVFVNIGRGGLVDNEALIREGNTGRIRLALDVVSVEPLTPTSPFVSVPNIILSPHIGGPTLDRYADCGAHALANVSRYLAGTQPIGAISLSSYDRAT